MKKKKKPIKAGSAVGWSLRIGLSQRGVGGTRWSVWETHSLSFSHIVRLLFSGTPSPPARTLPSPLPKAVNATKDTFPIVPGTAERSLLVSLSPLLGEGGWTIPTESGMLIIQRN